MRGKFVSNEKLAQYTNVIRDLLIMRTGIKWKVEYDTCDQWNLFVKFMCTPLSGSNYASVNDIIEADDVNLMDNFYHNANNIANDLMVGARKRAIALRHNFDYLDKYFQPIVPPVYYEERRHTFSEMVEAMKTGQMTATEGDDE